MRLLLLISKFVKSLVKILRSPPLMPAFLSVLEKGRIPLISGELISIRSPKLIFAPKNCELSTGALPLKSRLILSLASPNFKISLPFGERLKLWIVPLNLALRVAISILPLAVALKISFCRFASLMSIFFSVMCTRAALE